MSASLVGMSLIYLFIIPRESISDMFHMYMGRKKDAITTSEPLPQIKEVPTPQPRQPTEVVSDSEKEDNGDPLAAFYDCARALQEDQVSYFRLLQRSCRS